MQPNTTMCPAWMGECKHDMDIYGFIWILYISMAWMGTGALEWVG